MDMTEDTIRVTKYALRYDVTLQQVVRLFQSSDRKTFFDDFDFEQRVKLWVTYGPSFRFGVRKNSTLE